MASKFYKSQSAVQDSLQPYQRLLEHCRRNDHDVELHMERRGWLLEVRDSEGLVIARARSRAKPPQAFSNMAAAAAIILGKR